MTDTTKQGYQLSDDKKQNDLPNEEITNQGEKGGKSEMDQTNSGDLSNDTGLTEEIDEREMES